VLSLALARGWYAILGAGGVLATAGSIAGTLSGSMFEWYLAVAGIGIGLLAIGAAAWVEARSRVRAFVASLGIIALSAVFLWPLTWRLGSPRDTVLYAALPAAVGLLAAARMAWARAHTPFDAVVSTNPPAPVDPR
jgi:hypothetical protein